jgi:hypothetical protein
MDLGSKTKATETWQLSLPQRLLRQVEVPPHAAEGPLAVGSCTCLINLGSREGLIWLKMTRAQTGLCKWFFFISTFISQGVHLLDQIAKLLPSASWNTEV